MFKLLTQGELRAAIAGLQERKARNDWEESYPGERRDLVTAVGKLVSEYERRALRASHAGPVSHTPRPHSLTPPLDPDPQVTVSVEYIPPGEAPGPDVEPEPVSRAESLLPSFEDLNFDGWDTVPPYRKPKGAKR